MRRILFALCALVFLSIGSLSTSTPAMAVDCTLGTPAHTCYGIATGNWGTTGTWSLTSGGVSCVCTPATGENVVFDAGSSGKTFTMEAAYSLASLVATGSTTATWTQNAFTLTITGNTFTLLSSMTYTPSSATRALAFTSTSGTTAITSAGKTFGNVTFNGVGGTFQPADALVTRSDASITLTNGTFDLATNNTNTTAGSFLSNNSNTRTVSMGSGTFSLVATGGTVWDFGTTTGLTFNKNTSTLSFSAASLTSAASFATGVQSYNNVTISIASPGAAQFQFQNAGFTIANLTINGSIWVTTGAATLTNSSFVGTDNAHVAMFTTSSTNGTASAVTLTNVPTTATWVSFAGITFSGGGSGFTATNCFDLKGNTGVTCSTPGGGGGRIIGG